MLIRPVRLDLRALLRRGERVAVGQRVKHAHARAPAFCGARGPHGARRVLLSHQGHHKGRVDARGSVHHDLTLVAPVPDDDRCVARQAAHHVPQLHLLCARHRRRVALLCILHVVIHEHTERVARIVEGFRQEHASAPDAEHVEARADGRLDHGHVRSVGEATLELLHRNGVCALGQDDRALRGGQSGREGGRERERVRAVGFISGRQPKLGRQLPSRRRRREHRRGARRALTR